jgi:hypothetical protein
LCAAIQALAAFSRSIDLGLRSRQSARVAEAEMERKSQVLDVEIDHDGQPYRASYFVEADKIFTRIGGRVLIAPLGTRAAVDTVKALLSGHVLQQSRKFRQAKLWSK